MICPVCEGHIALERLVTFTIRHEPCYGVRIELVAVAHCESCSLVSELNLDTGRLVDLHITMSQLLIERKHPLNHQFSLLRGRKDS